MYVTDIQRNTGEMTVAPLYRQDFSGKSAAQKIQAVWRSGLMEPYGGHGAFDTWYGLYPNICATKIQAITRGYQARAHLPMVRMTRWISDNIITPKYKL